MQKITRKVDSSGNSNHCLISI